MGIKGLETKGRKLKGEERDWKRIEEKRKEDWKKGFKRRKEIGRDRMGTEKGIG